MAQVSGQGRKLVSQMRRPQVGRLMTATVEMKGLPLYQRELVSIRAAPSESRYSYPCLALPVPPPCSPSAFGTPAWPYLPQQEQQQPSLCFNAFSRAGSRLSLPGRASLLFLPPTKEPSAHISIPHTWFFIFSPGGVQRIPWHFIGEGKCSAMLSALPFSQNLASKIDGGDASVIAGSNVGKFCSSHMGWTLEAQARGLSSLATSLHTVGTQPLHSHGQKGCSGLRETTRATSRPEAQGLNPNTSQLLRIPKPTAARPGTGQGCCCFPTACPPFPPIPGLCSPPPEYCVEYFCGHRGFLSDNFCSSCCFVPQFPHLEIQRIFCLLWDLLPLCRMALGDMNHLLVHLSRATHSSAPQDPAANIKQGFGAGSDCKFTLAPGQDCARQIELQWHRVFTLVLPAAALLECASGQLCQPPSPA